ncbi:hypothetical protein [Fimbriimonas ginsengisoli]|uniref:Uncharacterized protein n=1 Tax=Fimbriimonas ginsengisoli Gsoil 348 TaxID=661478 RepID=A0A068NUG7_FIMGI|nr:hypothetical protein [Fimbriimonas ginsengisoli]AIE87056.1 hypothetical protein OP10G_3688 [Fimbriimonas ginsengisoli Gsoil 348]
MNSIPEINDALEKLRTYPFLQALLDRRSRRFGRGMEMKSGPMAFKSRQSGEPLTEEEEALMVFAACGITGYALGDLDYGKNGGGNIMVSTVGRTIPSGDAMHTVALMVTNDQATYFIRRPQDLPPDDIPALVELAKNHEFVEIYRRMRVRIKDGRVAPPMEPLYNLDVNRWSCYDKNGTYFVPVCEYTQLLINGLLEIFGRNVGAFILDERATFRPAGIGKFAKSKGGHLNDNAAMGRVQTIEALEGLVSEAVTVEQGMMLQNLALMAQSLGLGGFPNWAAHPFGWLEAAGFRLTTMPSSQYLGMNPALAALAKAAGKVMPIPLVQGLEKDGEVLMKPFCPPYYASMSEAVQAAVDIKFGPDGMFRGRASKSAWLNWMGIQEQVEEFTPEQVEATKAYCEYVYRRYGRFPAYGPPIKTLIGFQSSRLDLEFYEKFYKPEAVSTQQAKREA